MAQKSGFFNALIENGIADRSYNADDYCDNLAVIISSGVLRSANDDLLVTANGLNLSVNIGRAWIKGHYFNNTTIYSLPAITTPTGASRIDRVVLRLDNTITGRNISIQYVTGTAATNPQPPALTRTDSVFELCLANVTVTANSSTVSLEDTREDSDVCGWIYSVAGDGSFFTSLDNTFNSWFEQVKNTLSSVTLFKRYKWQATLEESSYTVQFNIPQYDDDTCFVEVYVNGLLANNYTQNEDIVTFNEILNAETNVAVYAYKSIDGTGIMSVSDEITQLQNEYAAISGNSKYIYNATGVDDNISLSEIAQAFYNGSYVEGAITENAETFLNALGGNAYLGNLATNAKITIEVTGKLGVSQAYSGMGTSANPYKYFELGQNSTNDKRIIFDFSKADTISIAVPNSSYAQIFNGTDLEIIRASVIATNSGTGTHIQAFASANQGRVTVTECNITLQSSNDAFVAKNGTFTNCIFKALSVSGNARIFCPDNTNLARVVGGTYYAYAAASDKSGTVFYTASAATNAVLTAENVNCPTVTESGYTQSYLSEAYAGNIVLNLVISALSVTGSHIMISNRISKSKI